MKQSKPLSILLSVLTALLVLTGSVAVPLLCRPFYYAHIAPLRLEEYGATAEQIRLAYDQMMDFCLGLRPDFAAGGLIFSEEGAAHFADVRTLFLLDLGVLGVSLVALLGTALVMRGKKLRPYAFRGRGPGFWGAVGLAVVFVAVGALAAVDFEGAFVVFHTLFFPGKTNWLFDWRVDPIILLLPEQFFMNCAILILGLILMWCAALIGVDLWAGKRLARQRKQLELAQKLAAELGGCQGCPSANQPGGCAGCGGNAE